MIPTFHGSHCQSGSWHHVAAGLDIIELCHQCCQFVCRQILFPLQVHPHFLSNVPGT